MKKPKLIEDKDREDEFYKDRNVKYYIEISYCPICEKKSNVDYLVHILDNNFYEMNDSDQDYWHDWWFIDPEEITIEISKKGLVICKQDYYFSDNELITIYPKEFKISDKILKLSQIISKDFDKYIEEFKRGNGNQPYIHFCSKKCVRKYILSKLK